MNGTCEARMRPPSATTSTAPPTSRVTRAVATVLAVAALAGVAGCGGDDTSDANEGATPSTTATGGDDQGSPVDDVEGGTPSTTAPAAGGGEGEQPVEGTPGGGGAPRTVEDAVARFEEFLHAFGAGDVATSCAIGRVAVEADAGGMSCEEAGALLVEMSAEEELAALRAVAVDRSQVVQTAPDRVEIPPAPPFSTEDPASGRNVVMEHDGTNWFVVE
jgi:hypothetical protein